MKKSKEVIVTVTGSDGCVVEGDVVKATIDKKYRKYVAVSPTSATTDANGQARFKIRGRKAKEIATVSFAYDEIEETVTVNVVK
jgi:hypothetical protein